MPHSMDRKEIDSGLICLVQIARFQGLAADADQIAHSFGEPEKPFDAQSITRAGRSLGLKVKSVQSNWKRLLKTPTPTIAQNKDGHFFILAGIKDDVFDR